MRDRLRESLRNIKRDALAGTITGMMAVPLTVGICMMSKYPVKTGIYTVIFAGFISFMTYLFRPGNYTGMPGVAAGLAPALALGVDTFGIHNMPFVILLTSLFQAIVWRYQLERYILRLVPPYLVEGLLAGVGLKIAMKFFPFLYDVEHKTAVWLNFEREVVLVLSVVSFIGFVLLYRIYHRKIPALPYVVILMTSVALSFFFTLPMINVENVPFHLALPLPDFSGLTHQGALWMFTKMFVFALMLGTIDIIEQVMSHVAIVRMDPQKREANTNNGLLAIWLANIGATSFGGMTNLDGLAKSSTNTIAGAQTKLSNVFTSLTLFGVVLFPVVLEHMPEYALGIIMVYSGWKMISNLRHVKESGRYAMVLSGLCGVLVYQLGIFEGLLITLFIHSCSQFILQKQTGKSSREILRIFAERLRDQKTTSSLS